MLKQAYTKDMETLPLEEKRIDLENKINREYGLMRNEDPILERSDGLDPDAKQRRRVAEKLMNGYLEQYLVLDLSSIPTQPEDDPETTQGGWEHEPMDVRAEE